MTRGDTFKDRLRTMLFESSTPQSKLFDLLLSFLIVASVLVVALDSVESIWLVAHKELLLLEFIFTFLFTIEYFLRLYSAPNKKQYITSWYGLIDLVAILPLYIGLLFPIARAASAVRLLRLFRLLRLLKMFHIVDESNSLVHALRRSAPKIAVFIFSVFVISVITGSLLSIVEQGAGFHNVFEGIFFTVNLLTTIGYTDVIPQTTVGRVLASIIVLIGYGIIAVPTGVVTVEFIKHHKSKKVLVCGSCGTQNEDDSKYCKHCGVKF